MEKMYIVIPAYQAENTILDSVVSALEQEEVDCQIYVVDHGSTDNTFKKLSGLIELGLINYIRLERTLNELKSPSKPLNTALSSILNNESSSTGWYIRLDADDVFLDKISLYTQLNKIDDIKFYASPMIFCYENKSQYLYDLKPKYKNYDSLMVGAAYSLPHHSCFYLLSTISSLFKQDGYLYDERITYGEDLDFSLRFLSLINPQNIIFKQRPLVIKYLNKTNITNNTKRFSFLKNHFIIFLKRRKISKILIARVILHVFFDFKNPIFKRIQSMCGYPGHLYGLEKRFDQL